MPDKTYLLFDSSDTTTREPTTLRAPNKKAAHERFAAEHPGTAVEIYCPEELEALRRFDFEGDQCTTALRSARNLIDEGCDFDQVANRVHGAIQSLHLLWAYLKTKRGIHG
jgi:hypothetical protein